MLVTRGSLHLFKEDIAAWSFRRKLRRPFSGLRFGRTNVSGVAFSQHWPHLLCWTWTLHITPHRDDFDGPRRWALIRGYRQHGVQTPWGEIRFMTQQDQWMPNCGPAEKDCLRFVSERVARTIQQEPTP